MSVGYVRQQDKEVVRLNAIPSGSIVFYDAVAYLGTKGINKITYTIKSSRPEPFHLHIYKALGLSPKPGKTIKTIL